MATRTERAWERRLICRDCGRTIDVLRQPTDGGVAWEGRADRDNYKRQRTHGRVTNRPTGFFHRHQLLGIVPDDVLLDPAVALAYCHPDKCGRVIQLDTWEVARMCSESTDHRIEV